MRLATITTFLSVSLTLILSASVLAQNEPRQAVPSYDVTLNVIAGSNDASQKMELPQSFAPITKQLKGTFGYSSFRLVNTYIGRIGDNGTIQYQSVAHNFGSDPREQPVFLDWQLTKLQSIPSAGGPPAFQIDAFRFGARVPVQVSNNVDASGRSVPVFNYEQIGLNVNRMSVNQGRPVLIGTMELPPTSGTVFLVLSVNPVEN